MVGFVADTEYPLTIPCDDIRLNGLLYIPHSVRGTVIFAHGSGSSRLSPRNQYIAKKMQYLNFATLLFDLLTHEEDSLDNKTMEFRFDIELLSTRLLAATHWLLENPVLHKLPMGYFGASTGAGAALVSAAESHDTIKAVVSRGGRPDLADRALQSVQAPTLLIVGGNDKHVIELNKKALENLYCIKKLVIVPGATHLFEEPGKMEEVAELAGQWFSRHFAN